MNKKETLEIRKQFTNENCAITRICGCYVDAEKQIRTELKEASLFLRKKFLNIMKFSVKLFLELSEKICSTWNFLLLRKCQTALRAGF